MIRLVVMLSAMLLFAGCGGDKPDDKAGKDGKDAKKDAKVVVSKHMVGTWAVNKEASKKALEASKKFKPEEIEKILTKFTVIKYVISDKEISMEMGPKKMAMPYTLKKDEDGKAVVTTKVGDKDVDMTVTLHGKGINIKGDSDDPPSMLIFSKQ